MNDIVIGGIGRDGQRMTSSEIAALVEKRHDNVKRTIETLVERSVIASPQIEEKPTAGRPSTDYVFAGEQGKRDSIVVVAQLCPEFTARLVDRWQELEKANAIDPQRALSDPASLRHLLLENVEKVIALQAVNAELAPKADALDRLSASEGSMTFTQAAKLLGIKQDTMTRWMHTNGWIYRQNGSWVAYSQHIQNGRLEYKEANYTDQKTGMKCTKPYCHITPKGLAKLAVVFGSEALKAA